MKLFFIRHGQTDWNLQGKIQGSYDSELNNTGIKQAIELSEVLLKLNYKFSRIYTSPQKRALKTAKILSEYSNIEYIPIDDLKEINMGEWEGLSWKEVEENYPTEYKKWLLNRQYTRTPNGESYDDMLKRVLIAINQIIDENSDNVVVISHSAIIMGLQCYVTNTPFNDMLKFKTKNATITEIDSSLFTLQF
ncbi:histidine phosphatase family protein [Clostridium sp. Sa3CUN1]|uniref:Histidine phosphatase family protein n=1 Tax=Clostridium gallinarum TaxID=2762246 RepID=A0ABR8Q5D4_9CLOT|nr:histidine phosphatase family protein [Clostridium gallinarum]MBD7915585.1 histidine phosphatase family protein [Clostridium gallinarum]